MMLYPLQSRNEETHQWCAGYGKSRNTVLRVSLAYAWRHRVLEKIRNDNGAMTRALSMGTEKNAPYRAPHHSFATAPTNVVAHVNR
jgi:hypothetical protein